MKLLLITLAVFYSIAVCYLLIAFVFDDAVLEKIPARIQAFCFLIVVALFALPFLPFLALSNICRGNLEDFNEYLKELIYNAKRAVSTVIKGE